MDTKALRQKILDLAIRGKLVPQDPNDEPASALLERIRAEKQQMVKDGKLKPKDIKNDTVIFKGDDNLHYEKFADGTVKCCDFESDYEIPNNWAWCNLGLLFNHNTGKALNSANSEGKRLTYITTSNVYWNRFELDDLKSMPFTDSEIEKCTVTKGDLLVCEGGDIGRAAIWNFDDEIRIQNHLHRLRAYDDIQVIFYYYVLYIFKLSGKISGNGIGLQGLSSHVLHNIIVPVPPIDEQKRIARAVEKSLSLITSIENHKEILSSYIDCAKSKILDLAIRGKLVPQDPNDEPASVLLERIKAEKEELIKQGKIKRDKKESVIFKGDDNSYYEKIGDEITCIDDELPFEIPDNWCWASLSQISSQLFAGGDKPNVFSKEYTEKCTVPIYSNGIENNGLYGYTDLPKVTEKSLTISARGTIGFACVRNEPFVPIIRLLTIVPATGVYAEYIKCVFQYFLEAGKGSSIPQLTVPEIKPKLIPVPPEKEQSRIVKRIDNVFSILNMLEPSST